MQTRHIFFAAFAIGMVSFVVRGVEATNQLGSKTLLFSARAGSKIRIEGASNVGTWQLESTLIAGSFEVDSEMPACLSQVAGERNVKAQAEVFIPVRSLKSVEQRWEPYNDQINEVVYKKLRAQEMPRIHYRLTELFLRDNSTSNNPARPFDSKGQLVIAGATNALAMSGTLRLLPDMNLKITGQATVRMSDFGLGPRLLHCFGPDPDEVKLQFEWLVSARRAP